MARVPMDISVPISELTDALQALVDTHDFTEDELRSECENAIDNVMED